MSTTETSSRQLDSSSALDAELALRLERLAARRAENTPAPVASGDKKSAGKLAKRRHAARKSRIAALVLSLATTGGLTAGFAAFDGPSSSIVTETGGVVATSGVPAGAATASPSTSPVVGNTIVNGDVHTNKWGPVQVQATFAPDGSIVSVDALQVPFADGKSVRINERAVPALNSDALRSQSANVDSVSGATYTSVDYEQSLQSAIDAARAAGITQLS